MKFDVAIVGSGLAGLSVALHLAQTRKVVVISKRALHDGASNWAQGGIAAAVGDTFVIELPATPSTGYTWAAASNAQATFVSSEQVTGSSTLAGAPGTQRLTFRAATAGSSTRSAVKNTRWLSGDHACRLSL